MTVYNAVFVWHFNDDEFNTVLYYDDNGNGPPDFQELTDNIFTAMSTAGLDGLVNDLTLDSIRWREDTPNGVGTEYFPTGGSLSGAAGASETAGQLALLVRKIGAGLVNPNKGRIYQPGVATGGLTAGGLWDGTVSNNIESLWESVLTIEDDGGVELDMTLKASNPTAPNTQAYNKVVGLSARGNPVTQRRRRRGVGI